ncbi:YceI family protein [Corallibacter sp.]|uniref:YceI family protein n=1 Tax=Corallibacter sp. TaxID=2038084 RepID=UPI003AB8A2FB
MKRITLAIIAFATFTTTMNAQEKNVSTTESKINWKGYKVGGSHEGTIALKSGILTFDNDVLTGGTFTIDMTSINTTDLTGEYKDKLDGHLKSDDFFGVATYPSAKIVFTSVKPTDKTTYKVTGDLTIKGNTNPVTFDLSLEGDNAKATLKIDRSKYNVRYGSKSFFDNLKDNVIYDEFDIIADLKL